RELDVDGVGAYERHILSLGDLPFGVEHTVGRYMRRTVNPGPAGGAWANAAQVIKAVLADVTVEPGDLQDALLEVQRELIGFACVARGHACILSKNKGHGGQASESREL